ncbi:hypothetical protein [Adhaeretor mobilis]|uniref:Uncharacterized protein n=1 Tax=Adhaeretor mobilis TaxID=1930276 RepID=A0A517MV69_9BACT|nr:hypothetical protein [Adhaeretor mobilis]QDS98784.1 hypothetical protein HG15A2_20690 [Adhaeretor mobilis]
MSDYLETAAEDIPPKNTTADVESRWHSYVGNRIPWYVRFLWLMFWAFAIYYTIAYLFPALQVEIVSPP